MSACKKIALAVAAATALCLLYAVGTAGADNGPHGGYTMITDKCAACHRAHTAQGINLLNSAASPTDVSQFCYTCHGGGMGATTDVRNGLLTTTNKPLLGGGFESVKMNVDLNTTGGLTLGTTSSHMVTGGSSTVWGYGPASPTNNPGAAGVSLTCTNCHNPHGRAGTGSTATYRLLKGGGAGNTPLFDNGEVTATASVDVADETNPTRRYNIKATNRGYPKVFYPDNYYEEHAPVGYDSLTDWCTQCHTRYKAPLYDQSGTLHDWGSQSSGDGVYMYRHVTNRENRTGCNSCHVMHGPGFYTPGCMTCHVAHGTGARMGTYSGTVPWPDGATTPVGNGRSALLRLDNRGTCNQNCHHK